MDHRLWTKKINKQHRIGYGLWTIDYGLKK
jgi:hypothetical protein